MSLWQYCECVFSQSPSEQNIYSTTAMLKPHGPRCNDYSTCKFKWSVFVWQYSDSLYLFQRTTSAFVSLYGLSTTNWLTIWIDSQNESWTSVTQFKRWLTKEKIEKNKQKHCFKWLFVALALVFTCQWLYMLLMCTNKWTWRAGRCLWQKINF